MADERRGFAGFEALVTDISDRPVRSFTILQGTPIASGPVSRRRPRYWGLPFGLVAIAGGVFSALMKHGAPERPAAVPGHPLFLVSPVEEKPPVPLAGQGRPLSAPQLRYCISQGIRIQGAEKAMGAASEADLRRFLALVDDYSPRCGNYHFILDVVPVLERVALEREGVVLIRSPATVQ